MPEGDTVWRAADRLHRALAGTTVTTAELRWPSLAANRLADWTTVEVVPRGKHLLHRFEQGWTLHSHLRMEGHWQVRATGPGSARRDAPRGRAHELRVRIVADGVEALGWRLGMLDLVPTDAEDRVVGHLGPDLLGADWDLDTVLATLATQPDRPLVEALLDQRVLAGIGTMWASDMLFVERLHPWRPAGGVDDAAVAALLERTRNLMTRACHSAISSSTGSQRRGETTWVHARSGRPCRRCGAILRVAMAGAAPNARTIFYCPGCQGGLAAVDDGRQQAPLGARPRKSAPVPRIRRGGPYS